MKVNIEIEVEPESLMDAVFENIWMHSSPWVERYTYVGYQEGGVVPVKYHNPNYDDRLPRTPENRRIISKYVSLSDVARGYTSMLANRQTHCFGILVSWDVDEWDSCCADLCLQYTIFGKTIYG